MTRVQFREKVIEILERHLSLFEAPELTFDKLNAFGKRSGGGVVFLTCNRVPDSFMQMVQELRNDLEDAGFFAEA